MAVTSFGMLAVTTNGTVSVLRLTDVEGRPGRGDAVKLASGASGALVQSANWSGAAAATIDGPVGGVCAVFGQGLRFRSSGGHGRRPHRGGGRQLEPANQPYGDVDGALAFAGSTLNAAGYSSVRTAVPGTKALQVTAYGGDALRRLVRRYCSAALCNHLP